MQKFASQFFDKSSGGDPVLLQHLFWLLGHPDFYFAVFRLVCYVALAVCIGLWIKRKTKTLILVAYVGILLGTVGILILGFLDIQRSFASGIGNSLEAMPAIAFRIVFHPFVQVVVFIALAGFIFKVLRNRRPQQKDASSAYLGFAAGVGILGSLSTLGLNGPGSDNALHDTYYVVALWNFVVGLVAITLFSAIILRAVRGRYPAWLGWAQFASFSLGVFCITLPQFLLPLRGMPRRYVDYEGALATWTGVTHLGVALIAISLLLMIVILALALYIRLNQKTDQL